jgi:HTH-type transcriptional regulator/antitoxin HigA
MKPSAKLSFSPQSASFARLPATFEALVKLHPPRPIHDKAAYDNTVEIVDVLAVAGAKLNRDQRDYLELLSTLVERYESETLPPLPPSSGHELLAHLLEEHGLGGGDLADILDVHRSVAFRILKGERGLTTEHIKALCARFGVPADVFLHGKPKAKYVAKGR